MGGVVTKAYSYSRNKGQSSALCPLHCDSCKQGVIWKTQQLDQPIGLDSGQDAQERGRL